MAEIFKINDNTWRIEEGFVRMFLLEGENKALLIDTGARCPEAKEIAESLTDKPVVLINTHGDGDHTSGNAAFSEFMMHPADYENCKVGARCPESRLVPVYDGDKIDLGGRIVDVIGIPGHTEGSIALLDSNTRTLYAGDSVQDGHVFMQGPHRRPALYADSLKKLIAIEDKFDTVCGFHGTPELPANYVRTVADAWQQVQEGKVAPREQDLHGHVVLAYDAEGCGFYCDKI